MKLIENTKTSTSKTYNMYEARKKGRKKEKDIK